MSADEIGWNGTRLKLRDILVTGLKKLLNNPVCFLANMTGVIPDTTYLIKIKACTPGGCNESVDGMQVIMPIEGRLQLFEQWEELCPYKHYF